MPSDCLGNPVTGANEASLAAIDDFVGGFLAYEDRAANILGAAEREPGHCLINAYGGLLYMLLESSDAPARAAKYLERAKAAAAGVNRREQLVVNMLDAWSRDDVPEAIQICDDIAGEFPRDLVMVKLNQYLNFNLGRFPQMLRAAEVVFETNRTVAYMHGMIAFAYEQCHLLDEAETSAREALRIKRKEPWAQHALAHVLLTTGRIDEGAAFLEDARDGWVGLNSFMSTHLWWHLCLFYLSQGRGDEVLAIYDRNVWGIAKDYSQDQIGAVSLLARLELAGVDVGERWKDVGEWLAGRGPDTAQPFLTVQYLYGLARAGRPEADALMAAIRERALTAPDFAGRAWREAALPLSEGLMAYARGDYQGAEAKLTPALSQLLIIGGSHAQRDLFEQLRLDAVLRNGGWSIAQQLLELRRATDRESVPVNHALAGVYAALELPAEAAKAEARARHTLAAHAARGKIPA
jgi:tetratricopeptide (TPR) repeat protein